METVSCACKKCSTYVGKFPNLWVKIGKSHYAPVKGALETESLQIKEKIRNGANNSVLFGSFLQNLTCKGCSETLGIRCEDAPAGHILKKDQLILRLGGMTMLSDVTGKKMRPLVQGSVSLETENDDTHSEKTNRTASLDVTPDPLPAATFASHIGDAESVSTFRHSTQLLEAFRILRSDVDRISGAFARIDDDIHSIKEFMTAICNTLKATPKVAEVSQLHEDVSDLAHEMGCLRQSCGNPTGVDDRLRIGVDEVDALADRISAMGQKINGIDGLKMEVQFMKARMKRLEDESRLPTAACDKNQTHRYTSPIVQLAHEAVLRLETTIDTPLPATASHRKRKIIDLPEASSIPKRSRPSDQPLDTSKARKPSHLSKVPLSTDSALTSEVADINELHSTTYAEESSSGDELLLAFPKAASTRPTCRASRATHPPRQNSIATPPSSVPLSSHSIASDSVHEAPSTAQAPHAGLKSQPKTRRRRLGRKGSETLRNSDGVRLTKKGLPDKRAGNYQYLKAYYELRGRGKKGVVQGEVDGVGDGDGDFAEDGDEDGDGDGDGEREQEEKRRKEAIQERERAVVETLKRIDREEGEE